jgi:hypothetical protein
MRWRLFIGLLFFAISMLACSLANTSQPAPSSATAVPPAAVPTTPPIAPGTRSVPTFPTQPVISVATPGLPVTATGTLTATISPTSTGTLTATLEATVAVPTVPPVSTGPLDFQVFLVGCRRDETREGGVFLTFKVEATGGNGVYTYVREGQNVAQISERPATKGSAVIDAWIVRSGDGQEVEHKFRFPGSEFNCP